MLLIILNHLFKSLQYKKIGLFLIHFRIDTADEKDEVSSTVSNLSDLSGLSDFSGEGDINHQWRNASSWVQKQMLIGADPRNLLHHLLMDSTQIPEQVDDLTLWKVYKRKFSFQFNNQNIVKI